jgi:hypothetical protein
VSTVVIERAGATSTVVVERAEAVSTVVVERAGAASTVVLKSERGVVGIERPHGVAVVSISGSGGVSQSAMEAAFAEFMRQVYAAIETVSGAEYPYITMEAAVAMAAGTPVCAKSGRLYPASNTSFNPVIGILRHAVGAGFIGEVAYAGEVELVGLTAGAKYYLGVGALVVAPPSVGLVQEMGVAMTDTQFAVGVRMPVLLS